MVFIQPCFIRKNTPELRKKLEELGYTNGAWETPHFEYPYLMCFPNKNGKYGLFKGKGFYMTEDDYRCDGKRWTYNPPKEYIDCGTNEEVFIALASLRDDSDKKQWFIYNTINNTVGKFETIEWVLCKDDNICDYLNWDNCYNYCHKATVEEIIEHFKKE